MSSGACDGSASLDGGGDPKNINANAKKYVNDTVTGNNTVMFFREVNADASVVFILFWIALLLYRQLLFLIVIGKGVEGQILTLRHFLFRKGSVYLFGTLHFGRDSYVCRLWCLRRPGVVSF